MKKREIIISTIAIIFVILIGAGFWVWENKKEGPAQWINQTDDSQEEKQVLKENIELSSDLNEIIQRLKEKFFDSSENIDTQIRKEICFRWTREDGKNFGPIGSQSVSAIRSDINSIQRDKKQIIDLLAKNGFRRNEKNNEDIKDIWNIPGERNGFEKDDIKCNIEWSELTPDKNNPRKNRFEVSCARINSEAEIDFKNFYSALKDYMPPKGYTKITNVENFCVIKKDKNFAMGMVGEISAPNWYAKKENGKWIVTMITQDYPLCERIEGFSEDYYGGKCFYTDENGTLKMR